MKRFIFKIKYIIICFAFISSSCNQDYPNPLRGDYNLPNVSNGKAKKTLYIILDGVNGAQLRDLGTANISNMTQSALYSYDALVDAKDNVPDAVLGWSNLLTGKSPDVHGANGGGALPDLTNNPTILSEASSSALFSSSSVFYDIFSSEADYKQFLSDENALVNAAKQSLIADDYNLFVVELNSADIAGLNGGFNIANTSYSDALITLDSYVGVLKGALESRESYEKEDWLIVVTSNYGGVSVPLVDPNLFNNSTKNIFSVYYSPRFASKVLIAPENLNFISEGLTFGYPASNPSLLTLNSVDKFGVNIPTSVIGSGTTYQFKVKMSGNSSSSWPTLISKSNTSGIATGLDIISGSGTASPIQVKTRNANTVNVFSPFGDGNWHTVTVVYERTTANQIRVRTYQDGNIGGTSTFNNTDNSIGGTNPLRIGRNNATVGGTPIATFYDLKVYDIPLSEQFVLDTYCQTVIDENSPHINNLKGYWLFNNVSGNQISNLRNPSDDTEKFSLSGATLPVISSINEFVSVFCPPLSSDNFEVVPFGYDNAFLIANWLGLSPTYLGELEGKGWSFLYKTNED